MGLPLFWGHAGQLIHNNPSFRLISQLYSRENQLRSEFCNVITGSARLLRLKEREYNQNCQSLLQFQQFTQSLEAVRTGEGSEDMMRKHGWLMGAR